ncbi:hypothetical protein [Treponema sp.]|uniref:hypothetical protein n=1 Tax=Treponema sp. TaxID=166 RepID=UPI003EFBBC63
MKHKFAKIFSVSPFFVYIFILIAIFADFLLGYENEIIDTVTVFSIFFGWIPVLLLSVPGIIFSVSVYKKQKIKRFLACSVVHSAISLGCGLLYLILVINPFYSYESDIHNFANDIAEEPFTYLYDKYSEKDVNPSHSEKDEVVYLPTPSAKLIKMRDSESEKAVFRAVYKDSTLPIVIQCYQFFKDYVEVSLCNTTGETIKEISFSYNIKPDEDAEQTSVSVSLSDEIPPFASFDVKIGFPVRMFYSSRNNFQIKQLQISYESGKNIELSEEECFNDEMELCIYKDKNVSISWKYDISAASSLEFEKTESFNYCYSYYRFNLEQYEGDGENFYDGSFLFEDNYNNGSIDVPNYLVDQFITIKSLEVEYLEADPDNHDLWQLSWEECRNLAKKVVINDEASLEQIRTFVSFMNIMGLM